MLALADSYTQDNWACYKTYKGSHWTVSIFKDGKPVSGIQVTEENYQPFVHFGNYGCGLCQHGMTLSKNTILYGAACTHMFSKALENVDIKKVEKQYYKEYIAARIADNSL